MTIFSTSFKLLAGVSAALLIFSPAKSQGEIKSIGMADCVKVLRPDSIHMFFDNRYALVPPDCAAIRRECKVDAQGNFTGEVRDYLLAGNALFHKVHFVNGAREGGYEQYHPNRQKAVIGQFIQGHPSGTWQYWYANGKPRLTLELAAPPQPMHLVAAWDSTGHQQVTAGAGTWEETRYLPGAIPLSTSGAVVAGLMDGTWKQRTGADKQVTITEEYRAGRLREGREIIGSFEPRKYKDHPILGPRAVDAAAGIEPFHFGRSCEEQAEIAARDALSALAPKAEMMIPQPPKESSAYQHEILRRLNEFNNVTQWMPRTDGQAISVSADIDAQGRVHNFASEVGVVASALASYVPMMGNWHPATINGTPVPGKVRFVIKMYSSQLQSSMYSTLALPLPAVLPQRPKQ